MTFEKCKVKSNVNCKIQFFVFSFFSLAMLDVVTIIPVRIIIKVKTPASISWMHWSEIHILLSFKVIAVLEDMMLLRVNFVFTFLLPHFIQPVWCVSFYSISVREMMFLLGMWNFSTLWNFWPVITWTMRTFSTWTFTIHCEAATATETSRSICIWLLSMVTRSFLGINIMAFLPCVSIDMKCSSSVKKVSNLLRKI